ncbi:hypothetical protein KY334_05380 [Candidatus Woesearchaeota archaeon]|nr:hypothetical protein [Candidatus Woesearchaeota archaeon]
MYKLDKIVYKRVEYGTTKNGIPRYESLDGDSWSESGVERGIIPSKNDFSEINYFFSVGKIEFCDLVTKDEFWEKQLETFKKDGYFHLARYQPYLYQQTEVDIVNISLNKLYEGDLSKVNLSNTSNLELKICRRALDLEFDESEFDKFNFSMLGMEVKKYSSEEEALALLEEIRPKYLTKHKTLSENDYAILRSLI